MEKKTNFLNSLNDVGFGLYLITIGSIGYLLTKGIKKLLDILAESLLKKYIESIRSEVDQYLLPMNEKLDKLDEEVSSIKRHELQQYEHQIGLLTKIIESYDNKNILNITAKEND